MSDNLISMLAQALLPEMEAQKARGYATTFKHDLTTGIPPSMYQYSHGPGGNLTFPGVDPVVFNASMGAQSLLSQLPTSPSLYMNPTYYTMTGVLGDTGSEPAGPCDEAPQAGLMKACLTTAQFGKYQRETPTIDLARIGQRVDRADPMDLRLVGSPMSFSGPFAGPMGTGTPADLFTNEIARKFWERNIAFHRLLSLQLWRGNPANNNAGGGYKEMTGLDLLINTGYTDIETNQACTAMDSLISDFNYQRISVNGGQTVVAALTNIYYQLRDRALRSGVMPVRWVMAMRPQTFYELTAIWPCSYLATGCLVQTNAPNMLMADASDAINLRDQMRAGSYLMIDGYRVDVIVDDGITEANGTTNSSVPSGCFASDIYFLPMSVIGGTASLYLEYFQFQNQSLSDALGNMVLGRIEGAFLTWPRQTNLCVQWQSLIEPRVVLRTPWLAARLRNVTICPIQHTNDAFPTDPYFKDGGKTARNEGGPTGGPSYWSLWNQGGNRAAAG